MPSLAAVVSAIVEGCVLITILLSYAIWLNSKDDGVYNSAQTATLCSSLSAIRGGLECILYFYPPIPSMSSLPRPKPARPRTPSSLYKTHPFSEEVHIAFPPGLNEDAASLVSQDLTDVRISEELEITEIAEEITGISGARREPGASSPPL
ncbi:hypothetical protein OBBRIDRAFT_808321 [Obba rivulosa]|uniref:Uncharacterized protein n=1 Tax=Obba rivulosa TaxID=1052685 RepID=A0A8E2DFZ9_9APHY|nr:hypothetical protein OBBRIDRAFT_808321 [Obba rivulosa]